MEREHQVMIVNDYEEMKKKQKGLIRPFVLVNSARKRGKFQAEVKFLFKGWKKIYGSVQDGVFYLYLKEKEFKCGQPTFAMNLALCISKEAESSKEITVADTQHVILIRLDNEEEKTEWLNAVDYEISLCKKRDQRFKAQANLPDTEERDSLLRDLHTMPENQQCADCSAESKL